MKFITYSKDEKQYVGILSLDEKKVYSTGEFLPGTEFKDMVAFIKEWKDEWRGVIKEFLALKKDGLGIEEVKILAPIIKPPHDIISLGVNYQDHLEESRRSMKINTLHEIKAPVYFSKRTTEILGPEAEIQGHFELDKYLDYEVELAVIIGRKGKDIPKERVKDYIFGYSIFNDFSARKLQRIHTQWFKGKSLDTFSTMGPCILHISETNYPYEVDIMASVNGETRQNSNTNMLINSIEDIIVDFSRGITLEPGDIIITGTPAGVGMGFDPPKYLVSGDEVECHIDGIGVLRNKVK